MAQIKNHRADQEAHIDLPDAFAADLILAWITHDRAS
jgi:hypothetical protein